ncbi:MAG TPA: hypothetical protein VK610_03890 [Rhodothermales bacterium]|nr:hypothetical protein [Rhodothermales bacterium]
MPLIPLENLKDWRLSAGVKDVRGRELRDSLGHTIGIIKTMMVSIENEQVVSIVIEDGRQFAVTDLQIMDSAIYYIPAKTEEKEAYRHIQVDDKDQRVESRAFIMKWAGPENAELDEVLRAIREVCEGLGFEYAKINSGQYRDKFARDVIDGIRESKLIVADMTAGGQKVYYELE